MPVPILVLAKKEKKHQNSFFSSIRHPHIKPEKRLHFGSCTEF